MIVLCNSANQLDIVNVRPCYGPFIVTVRNIVAARLCFHRHLGFCSWREVHWGRHPPGRHPPMATAADGTHPTGMHSC